MTHEYVIAVNGKIGAGEPGGAEATAVGWAAEAVLAVGSNDEVRSISRGDSTFLDLGGCLVTVLPADAARAARLVAAATRAGSLAIDVAGLLIDAGLLDRGSKLEPGSPADLAFWAVGQPIDQPDGQPTLRLVATVHNGAFIEGDEHCGPFPAADPGPSRS